MPLSIRLSTCTSTKGADLFDIDPLAEWGLDRLALRDPLLKFPTYDPYNVESDVRYRQTKGWMKEQIEDICASFFTLGSCQMSVR